MRGCWTTRPPLGRRERRGLVEDLLRDRDLADVVEQRGDPDPVDLGLGQLELLGHLDDDRGDERRRLAAVVGERRDERGQHVRGRVARLAADLHRPGAPEVGDRCARDPGVLVGLLEDVGLVAPERLGRIHRGVRVADEVLHPELLPGPTDDADRDRDRQRGIALDAEALPLDELAQLLAQRRAFLDVGLGEDEHEFLAAVAADEVARPEVLGDGLGDPAQDDVAGGVAVRVVDRLEVVDVDEGDAQRSLVARRPLDFGEQGGEERLAVGDAGQPVDGRAVVRVGERGRDGVDRGREPAVEAATRGRALRSCSRRRRSARLRR